MSKTLCRILLVLLCLAFTSSADSQTTAQISGQVTDQSGAAVAGAKVQVTNLNTNATRATDTTPEGNYVFGALPIGPYKLDVSKEGFQTFIQSGIVLQVNSNPAVNVTLLLGNVQQTVEVQANAGMVETQSTGVGAVIQPEQVIDLPLNGRQATQLVSLAGAAVAGAQGTATVGTLDYPSAVAISIAGNQVNATNYLLDGSLNMDYRTNVGSPMPFPDALQEFKVDASAVPANAGSRPGGAVSSVTKSGTNAIHGDVFEFLRNGIMDAESYAFPLANGTVPPGVQDNLKRNQFGGTIGGPIIKNKLFGFYGFQETIERQQQPPISRTVPTPAVLAGDFRAFLAPPCQSSQQFLNDTVPSPVTGGAAQPLVTAHHSNMLLPSWVSTPSAKIAAKIASQFPATNNPCGSISTSAYQHDNEYQHVGRADWQRTDSDSIFARYFIANYSLLSFLQPGNLLSTSGVGLADRVQNLSLGDTHVLNPHMVSSFRVYFGRTATVRTSNNDVPNICSFGVKATCPLPHVISALFLVPGNLGWDYENVYGISENIGWQLGAHSLDFGFSEQHIQMNADGVFQVNPLPTFTNGASSYTGNNIGDFVTGNVDGYGQGNGQLGREAQNVPSLYFQDNWKLTQRLQLNLGVRWDPFFPQRTGYGMASDFNKSDYLAGKRSKVFVNAPPGVTFPGDPGFNGKSDNVSRPWDFSPRVGFVFDPRGKGMETVRGGYGIFYDTSMMWNTMHVVLNPPWGATINFTPAPVNVASSDPTAGGGLANPFFNVPGGNPFPTPFNPPSNWTFGDNGAWVFIDKNIKPANVQQWNLSMQKQFGSNWLASASYMGSKTTHLWLGTNLNRATIITAGMTAPGIVSTAGMTGTNGPCTLLYKGKTVTFPTCNAASTVSVNGINNQSARKALTLANPDLGPVFNGGVLMARSIGNGSYNGLLLSLQHRLSHGFSINGNYTWSHCLDEGEPGQDVGDTFQDANNPRGEWGNCGHDRRQLFNLSLVAQTPKFSSAWLQRIAGNWSGSGIFTATTGGYVNVLDGSDVSLVGLGGVPGTGGTQTAGSNGDDRPNQVGDPFQSGTVAGNPTCVAPDKVKTVVRWFNTCAFARQAPMTFGNTHRNALLGPGRWNFDTAIWRTFPITERYKLDFRAEGFNVFNHPQFGNPGAILSNTSTFGRITTLAPGTGPRILQMALKLTF